MLVPKQDVMGYTMLPKIHMLKSSAPGPQNGTVVGDGVLKEVVKVK